MNITKYKIEGFSSFDDTESSVTYWVIEEDKEKTFTFITSSRSMTGGAEYEKVRVTDYVNDIESTTQDTDNRTNYRI